MQEVDAAAAAAAAAALNNGENSPSERRIKTRNGNLVNTLFVYLKIVRLKIDFFLKIKAK